MGTRFGTAVRVERVQTGVRIEKRILKVLKGLAEYLDMSVGDLLEGIALHVFEGQAPFRPSTLQQIAALKKVYGLNLTAKHSHRLVETSHVTPAARRTQRKKKR